LTNCNLSEANVSFAEFYRASLAKSRFPGTNLKAADLTSANLRGARELTYQQLTMASTGPETILPNGGFGPYRRGSGAERPR
jgi:uncharacterized protein YjbI with pentapeptide repeats